MIDFRGPHSRTRFRAATGLGLLPRDGWPFTVLNGLRAGAGPWTAVPALFGMTGAFWLNRSF